MKKIVILTSKGGYGHMAACAALKNILTDYEVVIINPFESILAKRDPINILTFGKYDGEMLYNKILQAGWIHSLNFFARYLVTTYIRLSYHAMQKGCTQLFKEEKPDLVISVIPLFNYPAGQACKTLNIPFMLITLDADITLWLIGMKNYNYSNFYVTVHCATQFVLQQLLHANIRPEHIHQVGFPLRKEFKEPKDFNALRTKWKIPDNKAVISLLMGSTGSHKQVAFTHELLKLNTNAHIMVCIGNNTKIIPKLTALKQKYNVSLSIIPFTQEIAEIMALSDLIITKPGPTTCSEAISLGVPILIDRTSPCVFWEKRTIDWVTTYDKGAIVTNLAELAKLVPTYLAMSEQMKHLQALHNLPNFDVEIKKLIAELLHKSKTPAG